MTDRQLAILIRSWANRLEREMNVLRAELPGDFPRLTNTVYTGGQFDGLFHPKDPAKYQELPGDYEILEGLSALQGELNGAADLLLSPKESEAVSQ